MAVKPKLLDLYCCEGGASMGYSKAGYDVYGVDLFKHKVKGKTFFDPPKIAGFSRKRYPFPAARMDVLEALHFLVAGEGLDFDNGEFLRLEDFAVIHASPPCQHASAGTRAIDRSDYPRLIEPTRELLIKTELPYIIENVRGADLIDPVELCGCQFNLTAYDEDGAELHLLRPRMFESNVSLPWMPHSHRTDWHIAGSYGGSRRVGATPAERRYNAKKVRKGGYVPSTKVQQALLGIDWMTQAGMHQSVPPAYTRWIGHLLHYQLREKK